MLICSVFLGNQASTSSKEGEKHLNTKRKVKRRREELELHAAKLEIPANPGRKHHPSPPAD
jgi:hypothetical protein